MILDNEEQIKEHSLDDLPLTPEVLMDYGFKTVTHKVYQGCCLYQYTFPNHEDLYNAHAEVTIDPISDIDSSTDLFYPGTPDIPGVEYYVRADGVFDGSETVYLFTLGELKKYLDVYDRCLTLRRDYEALKDLHRPKRFSSARSAHVWMSPHIY